MECETCPLDITLLKLKHYQCMCHRVDGCFFMDTMFFLVASLPNTNYGDRSYLESGKRLLGQSSAVSKTRKIWSGKSRGNMFDNNDINSFSTPLVKQKNNSVTYESFRCFFWILSIRLVQTCGCNNILLMQCTHIVESNKVLNGVHWFHDFIPEGIASMVVMMNTTSKFVRLAPFNKNMSKVNIMKRSQRTC